MYSENFYKIFINESINPFVLFTNEGKLFDYNYEAEVLFNDVSPKEIYELALANSSYTFGFEKKYITLKYGKSKYYAILVGYIDDEYIGIELYRHVNIENKVAKIEDIEPVNIYSLIEIAKTTNFDTEQTSITEVYDTSLPEMKLNINNFLLTLNKCFELYKEAKNIQISVNLKIGEYEIINEKKYSIICMTCNSDTEVEISPELEQQALKSHINIFKLDNKIKMEFPMIL